MSTRTAKAGWYADSTSTTGGERYWDGAKWTDQRRDAPPPPPPPSNRGKWIALGAIALVLLIAAGILVAGLVKNTAASSDTFDVKGTLTLNDASGFTDDGAGNCQGKDGYSDISTGAQVSIKDSAGKVVAVGSLGESITADGSCSFDFRVDNVPGGNKIYAVEVTHRGDVNFSRDEAGAVSLTLGNN
ncbi:MAG: DUF2510 domain-containing protein [Marmoricola sp.]|nr:DUF2510 domain-containing protein [Marmoricola sp.]